MREKRSMDHRLGRGAVTYKEEATNWEEKSWLKSSVLGPLDPAGCESFVFI